MTEEEKQDQAEAANAHEMLRELIALNPFSARIWAAALQGTLAALYVGSGVPYHHFVETSVKSIEHYKQLWEVEGACDFGKP